MSCFASRLRSAALPLALLLLGSSLAAQAQEVSVALPDLTYLPGEGHLVSDTELSYQRLGEMLYEPEETFGPGGVTSSLYLVEKSRRNTYGAAEGLRYGLFDGLVVGISEQCEQVQDRDKEYFPGLGTDSEFSIHNNTGGCDNPIFSATWRVLGQTDFAAWPVNLDLFATLLPDLVKNGSGNPSPTTGGYQGEAGVAVSRAFDEFSLLGRAGVAWFGKKNLGGPFDSETDSAYARPYATLLAQYKPDEALFLTAGISAYAPFDNKQTFNDSYYGYFYYTADYRNKVGISYQPEVGAAWLAVPDLLSVSLRYSHSFDGSNKQYSLYDGSLAYDYRAISSDTVSLDFRFQLF